MSHGERHYKIFLWCLIGCTYATSTSYWNYFNIYQFFTPSIVLSQYEARNWLVCFQLSDFGFLFGTVCFCDLTIGRGDASICGRSRGKWLVLSTLLRSCSASSRLLLVCTCVRFACSKENLLRNTECIFRHLWNPSRTCYEYFFLRWCVRLRIQTS